FVLNKNHHHVSADILRGNRMHLLTTTAVKFDAHLWQTVFIKTRTRINHTITLNDDPTFHQHGWATVFLERETFTANGNGAINGTATGVLPILKAEFETGCLANNAFRGSGILD